MSEFWKNQFFPLLKCSLCNLSQSFERAAQPICALNGAKWPRNWASMLPSDCQHRPSPLRKLQGKSWKFLFFPLKGALLCSFSQSFEWTAQPICVSNRAKWLQNWESMPRSDFQHRASRMRAHQVKILKKNLSKWLLVPLSQSFERMVQPICTPNGAKWLQNWESMPRTKIQHRASRMRKSSQNLEKKEFFPS